MAGTTESLAVFDTITQGTKAEYKLEAFGDEYSTAGAGTVQFMNSLVTLDTVNPKYNDPTIYKFSNNVIVDVQDDKYTSYEIANLDVDMTDIPNAQKPSFKINVNFADVVPDANAGQSGQPSQPGQTPSVTKGEADTFALGTGSQGVLLISDITFDNYNIDKV